MKLVQKLGFSALLAIGLAVTTTAAQAGDFKFKSVMVDRSSGVKVKIKEKVSYDLDGWRHVSKIKVKVKGDGFKYKMKLKTNGMSYDPIYDGGYLVYNVNQVVRGLEFWGDDLYDCDVDGIYMDALDAAIRIGSHRSFYLLSGEIEMIERTVRTLMNYSSRGDQITYLDPILVLVAEAQAQSYGHGERSRRTISAVDALVAQVDLAKPFFKEMLQIPATYDITVALLSFTASLEDIVD